MPVLINSSSLLVCADNGAQGDLGTIDDGALAWRGKTLEWVGPRSELPDEFRSEETIDANGALVLPGLIDCHTHLAFAGSRADEFEMRIQGVDYLEIARRGGGIKNTVRKTRAATEDQLFEGALARLESMVELGITTVECKSGYGLDLETESKLLQVYRRLSEKEGVARTVPTFLGAHVVAPEYSSDRSGYIDLVVETMLPQIAEQKLATFCDVFVEEGAFSSDEARTILGRAGELGMRAKLHVDQLSEVGGGELAAELGAISADHLEYISQAGIEAMADKGVVAVSLPLASFFLRQPPMPARRLIEAGVPVAVATDFNPGTAPSHHLPLALLLACVQQKMTAAEAIKGATIVAARAIGLESKIGSLESGKQADFILVDAPEEEEWGAREWIYHFRSNATRATYRAGVCLWRAP